MDTILAIRDKYSSSTINVEQFKELIRTATVQLGRLNRDDRDRVFEEAKKLESLNRKIVDQQENLSNAEQILNVMVNELTNHNELLKELEAEKNQLIAENCEVEIRRNQLKVQKPSVTDQKLLESGRKKFDYYKVLTGIRWDYPILKSSVKGYITDEDCYVHSFCYDKNDKRVELKLWKEIEKSANHKIIQNPEEKENLLITENE